VTEPPEDIISLPAAMPPDLPMGLESAGAPRSSAFDLWEFFERGNVREGTDHWCKVCK